MKTTLRFFWNGIKTSDGQLQKCSYSDGQLRNSPAGTITIYAGTYRGFSREIADAFTIENNSDGMTDYFEHDRIRVMPNHPLYAAVNEAMAKRKAHYSKRFTARPDLYGEVA